MAKIIKREQADALESTRGQNLPPAGDERREVLAKRTDELAEAAETVEAETYPIDPKALQVENEIAQHFDEFNELAVSDRQSAYEYRWVWTGLNNIMVKKAMAERYPGVDHRMGWEIVSGDMPEAREHKDVQGVRRVGDTILLRCRKEFWLARAEFQKRSRDLQRDSVTANLKDMAARYANKGLNVLISDEDMDSPVMKQVMKRMLAREIAGNKFEKMLRAGSVPGVPVS